MNKDEVKLGVITVGAGRGFIVEGMQHLMVITAAHCLPHQPPAHAASYTSERTYPKLLAGLGDRGTVWAECLFVDPVADIAVLGSPDGQDLYDEAEAYDEFVGASRPLPVRYANEAQTVWLLSLEGQWFRSDMTVNRMALWLANGAIKGGMSGSPIMTEEGAAIGVVVSSAVNPRLMKSLPAWLVDELTKAPGP